MKSKIGFSGRFRARPLAAVVVAGASFAAVQTSSAAIVYSGVVDHAINLPGPGQQYVIDFDSTAPAEVRFFGDNVTQSKSGVNYLNIDSWNNGFMPVGKLEKGGAAYQADALAAGSTIDSTDSYVSSPPAALFESDTPILGAWSKGQSAYLGFVFDPPADPQPHYGWVNVIISSDGTTATIHDWAWQSAANTPITTGEVPEPTGALLVAGATAAAAMMRRRRS